ncbi:hypothetical protein AVEN_177230-1 [Araneus ventricosus]|uniref:Uncharacterized protein n=1 Tax=Araneus ventricosus TaxID=182803 RepID=A0A4Y2KW63_ARAVE|nr:hypothetical protein AVEN_177230-1 [Araneus ventricosus]
MWPGGEISALLAEDSRFDTRFYQPSAKLDIELLWRGSLERGRLPVCRSRHLTTVQNCEVGHKTALILLQNENLTYCSATDHETTTFVRFYTGKGCQAVSHMIAFPEFFVRSRSLKCKHHLPILHFPPILMKITPPSACAKARRVSESFAIQ